LRRRVIRWFRLTRLLDAAPAADMLKWENSGFSIDASVRITIINRDVPSCFGRGRKSTRPGAQGVVELSPFGFVERLADLVPPPRKHRHHGCRAQSQAQAGRHGTALTQQP
jgi:hypothetical protein